MLGPSIPTLTIPATTASTRTTRRTVWDVTTQYTANGNTHVMYVMGSNMNPCPAKPSTYGCTKGEKDNSNASS